MLVNLNDPIITIPIILMQIHRDISQAFSQCVPELTQIQARFPTSHIHRQMCTRDIDTEFELIRAITETKKHKQGLRLCEGIESRKNRYPEQSIYEHSRVTLAPSSATLAPSSADSYINANSVPVAQGRKMIVTQGPLQATIPDFNKMLRQEGITCVVMLCRTVENGKNRCADYLQSGTWHKMAQTEQFETVEVSRVQVEGLDHQIEHLYFPNWPDKGVPADPSELDQLIARAKAHTNIVIHCSAGLGRSGVVGAVLREIWGEAQLEEGVSVFESVRVLRESRFGAVQNSQQYRLVYEYLSHFYDQE